MKIGYNGSTAIKRSNLELDLKLCEKYGFDCMEFRVSILKNYVERGGTIERIREFFQNSNLKPHAMNSIEFFNMKSPEDFELIKAEFESLCKLTRALGSDLVIAVPSFDVRGTFEEIKQNTIDCLIQFSNIAQKYEVRVGFEPVGFPCCSVNNFAQAYEIVQAVNKKNVGLVVDMYHFYISGSQVADLSKADGSKIFMVHINDAESKPSGTYDSDAYRVMPGDGVIPMTGFFNALKKTGYNDIVSIELFNSDIWEWEPEIAIRTAKEKCEIVLNKNGI